MIDRKYTLKELRARENKTQKEVAKEIGISAQTYCKYEQGLAEKGAKLAIVKMIAAYFEVTLDELKI